MMRELPVADGDGLNNNKKDKWSMSSYAIVDHAEQLGLCSRIKDVELVRLGTFSLLI